LWPVSSVTPMVRWVWRCGLCGRIFDEKNFPSSPSFHFHRSLRALRSHRLWRSKFSGFKAHKNTSLND